MPMQVRTRNVFPPAAASKAAAVVQRRGGRWGPPARLLAQDQPQAAAARAEREPLRPLRRALRKGNELLKKVRKCQSCMVSNLPARTRRRGWRWRRGWWARCCPEGSPPPWHCRLRAPEKKTLREQHSRATQSTHMHTRQDAGMYAVSGSDSHLGQPHSTHKKHA